MYLDFQQLSMNPTNTIMKRVQALYRNQVNWVKL